MIDINRLFAKSTPPVTLIDHCCQTGELAGRLWDLGVIDKQFIERADLCILVALHDLGKCHPDFQRKGLSVICYVQELMDKEYLPTIERKYRHEIGTEQILISHNNRFSSRRIAEACAGILRLHHQKTYEYNRPYPKGEEWAEAQLRLIESLEVHFNRKLQDIDFTIDDATCTALWGIVILADWLASGGLAERVDCLFERKGIAYQSMQDMFKLPTLRPLQAACEQLALGFEDSTPSAIIIEAPMGEGKTEAALHLAVQYLSIKKKNGFYIALPTMATARQMEDRVSNFLNANNVDAALLVHSEAWLNNDIIHDEEVDKSWFAPTKRSLLTNYAVGTVDQAMMSVLRIRNGVLRLLGLSSKVLVIDEVHAYDTYMQTIIFRMLEWCRVLDIPVIILSATLPCERRMKLLCASGAKEFELTNGYPMLTSVYRNGKVEETAVDGAFINKSVRLEKFIFSGHEEVARQALASIQDGGCACVIMNTIRDAQEIYELLKKKGVQDTKLLLFHSRFLVKDRAVLEKKCLELFGKNTSSRPAKSILVATQVVEQSLDIDFDYMISALAPIDLLLQRCGRLHRHKRSRPKRLASPKFCVFTNDEDIKDAGVGRVYEPWIIQQTQKVLSSIDNINIPGDIRSLIEEVYEESPQASDNNFELWMKQKSGEAVLEGIARDVVFPTPMADGFFPLETGIGDFFEETDNELFSVDAATRIGNNNIKLAILPLENWEKAKLNDANIDYARVVIDYSVSVRLPRGCEIALTEEVVKCGGYLKGTYAIQNTNKVVLTFLRNGYKTIEKRYTIDKEYGLKEDYD